MRSRLTSLPALAGIALAGACGYYNTMYNANRLFADAEKAVARGDLTTAHTAYQQSIQKARANLKQHPRSRWSDDARLLMVRAFFELGEADSARAYAFELLETKPDASRQAAGQLYLGLLAEQQGAPDALSRLDAALQDQGADAELVARARLARARIHAQAGRRAEAISELSALQRNAADDVRAAANLLQLRLALSSRDSAAAAAAWRSLLHNRQSQRFLDSIRVLAHFSTTTFSATTADRMLTDAAAAPWRSTARDSLLLLRADLALTAGDTSTAIATGRRIAARASGSLADLTRVRVAEWLLARAQSIEQLAEVRAELLPALTSERARALVQSLKTIEVLLEHARGTGQPLAVFAAAELARDELHAPALAHNLFVTYAEIAAQSTWAPKALLAALALRPDTEAEIGRKLDGYRDNPYVALVRGEAADQAFTTAELRLTATLQPLIADAMTTALRRDNAVGRAVAVIDSIRVAARNDSTRVTCGVMLDSLAVRGIRADSVRSACLRGDRDRVALLLKIDTLTLRDTLKAKTDTTRIRRDTMPAR
jgi:hypothetical protein